MNEHREMKNKREMAIISAYTGYLCCDFADLQEYLEKKGLTPYTHTSDQIREAVKDDFESILVH